MPSSTASTYTEILAGCKGILGEEYVFTDEESLNKYAHDETENLHFLIDIEIKKSTAKELFAVMKIYNKNNIPITKRGAG